MGMPVAETRVGATAVRAAAPRKSRRDTGMENSFPAGYHGWRGEGVASVHRPRRVNADAKTLRKRREENSEEAENTKAEEAENAEDWVKILRSGAGQPCGGGGRSGVRRGRCLARCLGAFGFGRWGWRVGLGLMRPGCGRACRRGLRRCGGRGGCLRGLSG